MIDFFAWDGAVAPISFTYSSRDSTSLLPNWEREESEEETPAGTVRHYRFTDRTTRLCVTAHVRTFRDFRAVEWVLELANDGAENTPIIEGIMPLDVRWQQPAADDVVLLYAH